MESYAICAGDLLTEREPLTSNLPPPPPIDRFVGVAEKAWYSRSLHSAGPGPSKQ